MHLPSALTFHTMIDGNGSVLEPAGLQARKGEMGGLPDGADGVFVIAPPARAGVSGDRGHHVSTAQAGRAFVALAIAGAPEAIGIGSVSVGGGLSVLVSEQSEPDHTGPGESPDGPAIVGESPDHAKPPARFDGEGIGGVGPVVIPNPELVSQPSESALPVGLNANDRGDGGGPLVGAAHHEVGKGQPLAPNGSAPASDAGLARRPGAMADHPQGHTVSARNGFVPHAVDEPGHGHRVSAPSLDPSPTEADHEVSAPTSEGQRARGAAESQVGVPGTKQSGIMANGAAAHSGEEPSAITPQARTRALAAFQDVSNPGLPDASDNLESRQKMGGQGLVAPGYQPVNRDGALAPAGSVAVASRNDGIAQNIDMDPAVERSLPNHVVPTPQAEPPISRGLEPSHAAPATTLDHTPKLLRLADASQTARALSGVAEVDPLRSVEAVPGEFRPAEIASNSPAPNPVARVDQGRAIAVQIAEVLRVSGERAVELRLQPEELGRVSLTMTQDGGNLQVTLLAERPETLEMMRRHIDLLGDELRRLGHGTVQFLFEDGAGHDRQQAPRTPESAAREGGGRPAEPNPPPDTTRPALLGVSGLAGGMDIRM